MSSAGLNWFNIKSESCKGSCPLLQDKEFKLLDDGSRLDGEFLFRDNEFLRVSIEFLMKLAVT